MKITANGVLTNDDEVLMFEVNPDLGDDENRKIADEKISELMQRYPAASQSLHNFGHKFIHDMDYVYHDLDYVYMIGYDRRSNKHWLTIEKSSGELASTRRL